MKLVRTFRRSLSAAAICSLFMLLDHAQAVNEYFDINGATAGSGVAASGSYNWDTGSGSNAWSTDTTGASATTAWPDGDNFARFAAGTDAAANNYTVTVSANHTFAGMALQFNGGGTNVTIANSGGAVLTMNSNPAGQGFFVGSTGSTGTQGLTITAPIAGDAITPLFWSGALPTGTSGSLFLYGNNTYAGGTVLNSSAGLNFNNANSFGTGPITYSGTLTTAVLANPTVGNFTIPNPVTMRSIAAANTTLIYTGTAPVTFSDWTLGSAGDTAHANILTVGNNTFTTAKMIINNLKGTDSNSNLTMTSGNLVNGTLTLTGTSTYGGITQIGGNTASTGLPTLQADDGTSLPSSSFLVLNGGVLQTSGSFTRDINTSNAGGPRMEWGANGGGFSAIGGQLTVDIGANNGNAGLELPWTTTLGLGIVGPLKFGSITANAKTLFIDPIDLNSAGTAGLTRTITVTAGAGGDSAEINQIIRTSSLADTILQKNGTGTLILSAANTYTGTTQVSGGALQASDGTGLPTASLLSLDGGVFQGTGVTSFTRPLAASGTSVQWTANGGGFSANGGQMTVNVGGAGSQLVWGTTVGSQIVGPLIFGSNTANAKTLFVNPINMNNSGAAATRTITVNAGSGGDSAELSAVLSNSSGDATLVKNGAGTLLLSAANTYTGGTTLSAGTLALGNVVALPSTGGLTLGGTLSNVSGSAITIPNTTTMTANSTLAGANGFTLNGSFTNSGANRTLTVSNTGGTTFNTLNLSEAAATGRTLTITGAGNTTFAGVIQNASAAGAGNGALSFNTGYTGTATINGTNTYSGTTTLSTGGTFVLGNKAAFGTSTVAMNGVPVSASIDLSGANAIANATVNFGGNNTFNGSNNIQFSGTVTATASRTVTNNISSGSLTFSGPVNLSSNATSNTLTVAGTGNTLISGTIANGGTSTASKLTKSGAGKLTVTGNNTYAGVTTVSAGTLLVNNDPTALGNTSSGTGSGAVTVAATATLGGTGRVGGALTVDGTVGPGVSIGTLKTGGNVALDATSHMAIDFANGGLSDLLDITGSLTINSGAFLDLTGSGTGPWTIASYTGSLTGTFGANVTGLPSGYAVDYGTTGMIKIVSAGVPGDWNGDGHVDAADYVTWRKDPAGHGGDPAGYDTWRANFGIGGSGAGSGSALNGGAVPEPSCIILAVLGLAAVTLRRRHFALLGG